MVVPQLLRRSSRTAAACESRHEVSGTVEAKPRGPEGGLPSLRAVKSWTASSLTLLRRGTSLVPNGWGLCVPPSCKSILSPDHLSGFSHVLSYSRSSPFTLKKVRAIRQFFALTGRRFP